MVRNMPSASTTPTIALKIKLKRTLNKGRKIKFSLRWRNAAPTAKHHTLERHADKYEPHWHHAVLFRLQSECQAELSSSRNIERSPHAALVH